ncbi:MAG: type II toxin-antitoxin system VapC family toxin [Desulfobulbia bacterium]
MGNKVFVDTSGFYAMLVKRDDAHTSATKLMNKAKRLKWSFVCTDYILDETATLLKARGFGHLLADFFDSVLQSRVCHVEWTDSERFHSTTEYFLKTSDQRWSFTDCLSFLVMRELKIKNALTKDTHFREAGFQPLLLRN